MGFHCSILRRSSETHIVNYQYPAGILAPPSAKGDVLPGDMYYTV